MPTMQNDPSFITSTDPGRDIFSVSSPSLNTALEGGGGSPEPPSIHRMRGRPTLCRAADAASATACRKAAVGEEKAAMGADDGGIAEGRADVMGRCERECGMRIGS